MGNEPKVFGFLLFFRISEKRTGVGIFGIDPKLLLLSPWIGWLPVQTPALALLKKEERNTMSSFLPSIPKQDEAQEAQPQLPVVDIPEREGAATETNVIQAPPLFQTQPKNKKAPTPQENAEPNLSEVPPASTKNRTEFTWPRLAANCSGVARPTG